jgi:maleylacetoacetate isomerase
MSLPTLYHYWRSTSSWRVRWMLAHKKIAVQYVHINLLNDDSDSPEHLKRNPMGYVPVLEVPSAEGNKRLIESVAIGEWLEETHPTHPLLPKDPFARAEIRSLCELINAGIQPLGNLTVTDHLSADLEERKKWTQFWVTRGFRAYEKLISKTAAEFAVGKSLTMADIFLIPMCYAALRNEINLAEFPTIARVNAHVLKTESAIASHPDQFKPA